MIKNLVAGLLALSLVFGVSAFAANEAVEAIGETAIETSTDGAQEAAGSEHIDWHFITCVHDDHECEHEAEHHGYDHHKVEHNHRRCKGHEHYACYGGHH